MAKLEVGVAQRALACGLLGEADLARLNDALGATDDDQKALEWLVEHGLLTKWQAAQLKAGKTQHLVLGHYKLLAPLGAGSMGAVFRAADRRLGREVALKVLPPSAATPEAIGRFKREALAALQLRHEHVVASFELGQQGAIHFLVMELVDGPSLAAHLAKKKRLSVQETARIGHEVALALEHARQQGIVHRDIKPSNILLSRQGHVKVADLGLAKFFGPQSIAGGAETRTGQFMGTIDYCSPEQAQDAKRADIRSDIYALGCTLYHCLAGKPPFPDGTEVERIMAHIELLPAAIRTKNPEVPPALAELIEKQMLAKQPADRFQTPAETAEALAPWARGEHGTAVNLWAALSGLEGLLEEAAPAVLRSPFPQYDTKPHADRRVATRRAAPAKLRSPDASLLTRPAVYAALVVMILAGITAASILWPRKTTETATVAGVVGADASPAVDDGGARSESTTGEAAAEQKTMPEALAAPGPAAESRRPDSIADPQIAAPVTEQAVAAKLPLPDIEAAPTAPQRSLTNVPRTPETLRLSSLPPLVSANDWLLLYGRNQFLASPGIPAAVRRKLTALKAKGADLKCVAFSPRGWAVLFNKNDFFAADIPREAENALMTRKRDGVALKQITFPPDNGWLVLFSRNSWNGTAPKGVWEALTALQKDPNSQLTWVAVAAGDRWTVLHGTNNYVQRGLQDGAKGQLERRKAEGQALNSIALAAGGEWAFTFGRDGLWWTVDKESEKAVAELFKVRRPVRSIAFMPRSAITSLDFSPDGRSLATGDWRGTVRLWDVETRAARGCFARHTKPVWGVAFSPDGRRLATAGDDGAIRICDSDGGGHEKLLTAPCELRSLVYHPQGNLLAAAGADGAAYLFDAAAGKQVAVVQVSKQPLWSVAFSPDGSRLATAGVEPEIQIWDTDTRRPVAALRGHQGTVLNVAFSPDGRLLASASDDKSIKIWDAESNQEMRTLTGHANVPYSVSFSRDGRRLSTGAGDRGQFGRAGEIILWDTATWQNRVYSQAAAGFFATRFSLDSDRLAGAGGDGVVRMWTLPPEPDMTKEKQAPDPGKDNAGTEGDSHRPTVRLNLGGKQARARTRYTSILS